MTLTNPSAMTLLKFWRGLREQDGLPLRDAVDPDALGMWLGMLSINDLHHGPDGRRVFVGIQGELVSRGMRDDFYGRYVDECVPAHALEHAMRPYLMAADEGEAVLSIIGPSRATRREKYFSRLVLPVADRDPSRTAYYLVLTTTKGVEHRVEGSIYASWVGREPDLFHDCRVLAAGSQANAA